jgi:hypothetical protein
MKILNHPALLALGISTLCLLFLIDPLVSPSHSLIYHLRWSATPLFMAFWIDLCLLWLFTAAVLQWATKSRRVWLSAWLGIVLFLPWIVLKNVSMLQGWQTSHRAMAASFLLILVVFAGLHLLPRTAVENTFLPLQGFASALLGFAGLAAVAILIQFGWCAWEARNLNPAFVGNSRSAPSLVSARHRRVIWILLDELSYQQVYEKRFPMLSLPAFDHLADQSVVFTHVVPAGIVTEQVVPSLFSGLPADQIRVSAQGHLTSLRNPITGAWQLFDQHNTIFADARNANYATAIAGWYNPYCRLLPAVLDRCFWTNRNSVFRYSQSDETWPGRVSSSLRTLVSYTFENLRIGPAAEPDSAVNAEMHIRDFQEIRNESDKLLADPSIDFVFLHVPVPHPPGIFDRRRMTFVTTGSSYLDNLVLADQYLAHVRHLLEQQHQWESSMVIIMGDHSWRTTLFWKSLPDWTAEEGQASDGGHFDDRPGFIVKMPMQQDSLRVETPFPAIKTRALLDAIIGNELQTGEELKIWSERQR